MKALAFNGSPRKQPWTTATLLENALAGAASCGAETKLYHLGDYHFSGCRSCYYCKTLEHADEAHCAVRDDLSPLLEEIREADVLFLGSPVYYYCETGMFRNFLERLLFPYSVMTAGSRTQFPRVLPVVMFYAMNIREDQLMERASPPFPPHFSLSCVTSTPFFLSRCFGHCETFLSHETLQVKNYSRFRMGLRDAETRTARHENIFPGECRKAYELGARLVTTPPGERQLQWQRGDSRQLDHG